MRTSLPDLWSSSSIPKGSLRGLVDDPFPSTLILRRGDDWFHNHNTGCVSSVLCDPLSIFKSIASEPSLAFLFPFHSGGNRPGRLSDLPKVTLPELARDQDWSPRCDFVSAPRRSPVWPKSDLGSHFFSSTNKLCDLT